MKNSMNMIAWGHNPGQFAVKDTCDGATGKRVESAPYPAVIAPWERSDDLGLNRRALLEATVNGATYIGGQFAARLPGAIRQMANGRLHADSPIYAAFAQMSHQHIKLAQRATVPVVIATALPVAWRDDDATAALEAHIRAGLRGKAHIRALYVRSEPGAVVYHEMLDDDGNIRTDQKILAKGVICVADIGGATLNRAVLEEITALPGQAASPLLGSKRAIDMLAQRDGIGFVDAEQRLRAAVSQPGRDTTADIMLRQYQEAVVAELQQAWSAFNPVAYLIAGGTSHWVGGALLRAFGAKARVIDRPQQAVATGLWRYAKRQIARLEK